jgi:hypothetical protein
VPPAREANDGRAMPVDGLPNPTLHRLCRRCGKWHHLHEGSYVMPASSGPVSWLINGYHRHADPQAAQRFVCIPCQGPARAALWQRLLASCALIAGSALLAWWLYAGGLLDGLFGSWLR